MLDNLIVPVLTRYDLLRRLLDSITYPVDHLLIIDNGGKWDVDMTHPYCDVVTVLRMPSNLGVAASWNLGIMSFPHAPYWAFASDDAFFHSGTLSVMADTKPHEMLLAQHPPHWQTFTIGEDIIRKVGLFGWGYHPAYFEDNDFETRAMRNGVVFQQKLDVGHDNSSTLKGSEKFQALNSHTFRENQKLFMERTTAGVEDAGQWELDRRRRLEWLQ